MCLKFVRLSSKLSVVASATTGEYHALRFVCMYLYVETTSASLRCTAWSASGGVAVEPSMCSAPHLIGLHMHAGAAQGMQPGHSALDFEGGVFPVTQLRRLQPRVRAVIWGESPPVAHRSVTGNSSSG